MKSVLCRLYTLLNLPVTVVLNEQIPLGISVAAGVRVGNSLGAGNPQAVKRTIKVAFGLIGRREQ